MGVDGQCHGLATFPQERALVPIVQEAGWAPGPVWMGVENRAPTGIRSLDHPGRSVVAIPTALSWPLILI
jgi:hypothetical protein